MGWYMVKSGLDESLAEPGETPRVSAYRLAAHLGTALLFYATSLNTAWYVQDKYHAGGSDIKPTAILRKVRFGAVGAAHAVFLTAITGAFVAGLDAGLLYGTYPKFADRWIPPWQDMFPTRTTTDSKTAVIGSHPLWRHVFENGVTVQFNHRMIAQATYVGVVALWLYTRKLVRLGLATRSIGTAANILVGLATCQVGLGIGTILLNVPISWAALHQLGSVAVLTSAMALVRRVPK